MSKARTLANLISDNAELADGQISVAEVVGAAPLASPTFTGTASGTFSGPLTGNVTGNLTGAVTGDVTAPEIDLSAISSTISDTAVDIFVYDTRKDSDGGAWRKRTQGTSWYNEAASATRGSRKEFPSVAVIVAESNQVTIYDGDDPDLPMWMVFENSSGGSKIIWNSAGAALSSISFLNGLMVFGASNSNTSYTGLYQVNFISEYVERIQTSTTKRVYLAPISKRNGGSYSNNVTASIVSPIVNDVAMTVLPNAPIDAATGLPVPTIAVATDGGVSVIKDDGTVVNITESSSSTNNTGNVQFLDNNKLVFRADGNTSYKWSGRVDIPSSTRTYSYLDEGTMLYVMYGGGASSSRLMLTPPYSGDASTATTAYASYKNNVVAGTIKGFGQGTTDPTQNDTVNTNLVNYTSSSYNTGWMNGDIKLATLSDTDDTDVTGSELVTNGTFDTDTSGWNNSTNGTVSWNAGKLRLTSSGAIDGYSYSDYFPTVVGKSYTLLADFINETGSYEKLYVYSSSGGLLAYTVDGLNTDQTIQLTFVATTSTTRIRIKTYNGTSGWDNVSVRLAEADRSVNGNGLQVFGTVTKNPVATGADLVAYSGFSSGGNYLLQPYNSDLDFGTGDFSVTWWMKSGSFSYYDVMARQGSTLVDGGWLVQATPSHMTWYVYASGWKSTYRAVVDADNGVWQQYSFVRRNGKVSFYVNGLYVADTLGTSQGNQDDDMTPSTPIPLSIGRRMDENVWALSNGSLALVRISATAPSPEQIARIYNDEKHLFTEGAQATLYGSSDSVTALAYDTDSELLHVGTSAGRSVFQGLRRVDNTTTAVTSAISASNGLVADE